MCRSPHAPGSRSSRSAPIAVSASGHYQSLLRDLRKCGIRISRSSSCAARSRGRRGAGSEVTRDEWYFVERARRCKQSARSRAVHRLVIPVYVTPLLQAWQSAAAKSQVRRSAALQSAVPVSCSYLLSQWRGRYLSQVQVALYPDPHAAPFTPTSATSSSVAQRVVERRCVRHPTSFSTGVLKLSQCVLIPLCTFVKRWHGRWQCYHPALGPSAAALKLLRCTFTSLRMVLRRWWSRDLFALHSDLLYPSEFAPLNFIVGTSRFASKNILRNANVPEFLKHRYARVRYTVKFKCVLASMLSIVHSWWDNHLLPHPTDRPHLFAGKYTAEYLMGVSRDFDAQ